MVHSGSCIPSRFQTPPKSLFLKDGQASSVQEPILASPPEPDVLGDTPHWPASNRPSTAADNTDLVRLDSTQVSLAQSLYQALKSLRADNRQSCFHRTMFFMSLPSSFFQFNWL